MIFFREVLVDQRLHGPPMSYQVGDKQFIAVAGVVEMTTMSYWCSLYLTKSSRKIESSFSIIFRQHSVTQCFAD